MDASYQINPMPHLHCTINYFHQQYKKRLKLPKGQSEDVNQRTDNTMGKQQSTKQYTENK